MTSSCADLVELIPNIVTMLEMEKQSISGIDTHGDPSATPNSGLRDPSRLPSHTSDSAVERATNSTVAQDGQEHINYVTGARFWLISIAYIHLYSMIDMKLTKNY